MPIFPPDQPLWCLERESPGARGKELIPQQVPPFWGFGPHAGSTQQSFLAVLGDLLGNQDPALG